MRLLTAHIVALAPGQKKCSCYQVAAVAQPFLPPALRAILPIRDGIVIVRKHLVCSHRPLLLALWWAVAVVLVADKPPAPTRYFAPQPATAVLFVVAK